MKYCIYLILFLFSFTACDSNPSYETNSNDLKEYIIVRYAGLNINYNDGTSRDEQIMKDDNGNDLKFQSLTGVINYMALQGWELEEVIAQPQYNLYSQDAKLIFSKPTTTSKLNEIIEKSIRK